MGLNVTVISYMDRVDFGFVVDPGLVPGPWAVSERIPKALAELKQASGLGPATAVADAFGATAERPSPAPGARKRTSTSRSTAPARSASRRT